MGLPEQQMIMVENRVWVAMVVILFAGMSFVDIDLSRINDTGKHQCINKKSEAD